MTDIEGNDDTTSGAGTDDANAPKALRDQNSKLNKQLQDALAALEAANAKARKADVAEWLKGNGAEAKLAKYIPTDVTDEDAVKSWLQENGEDFGWEDPASVDTEVQDQQQAVARATANAPQPLAKGSGGSLLHDLQNLTGAELKARGLI